MPVLNSKILLLLIYYSVEDYFITSNSIVNSDDIKINYLIKKILIMNHIDFVANNTVNPTIIFKLNFNLL